MKQIDIIRQKCKDAGLTLGEVFREAKVPNETIANWKKREPKSFETLNRLNSAIEKLTNEKENNPTA